MGQQDKRFRLITNKGVPAGKSWMWCPTCMTPQYVDKQTGRCDQCKHPVHKQTK